MLRNKLYRNTNIYPDVAPLPLKDEGWGSTLPIFDRHIRIVKPEVIIEVGSWFGSSAMHMAKLAQQHKQNVEVICVDTFLGDNWHWAHTEYDYLRVNGRMDLYPQFLSNVIHKELTNVITPLPLDSVNAYSVLIENGIVADLIYIDGGHTYDNVSRDLVCYKDLLRVGGIMIIDDAWIDDVRQACKDVLGTFLEQEGKFVWEKK